MTDQDIGMNAISNGIQASDRVMRLIEAAYKAHGASIPEDAKLALVMRLAPLAMVLAEAFMALMVASTAEAESREAIQTAGTN